MLEQKFRDATAGLYDDKQSASIATAFENHSRLDEMPAAEFMELMIRSGVDAGTLIA